MSSSSSNSGFEAVLETHSHLFNHKPFVQSEINNFVREFEEKRGDREVDKVFSCLERVSELRDIGLPQLSENLNSSAPTNLLANLQVSESMFGRILEQEDSKEVEKTLAASRDARERDWDTFLLDSQARCKRVDQSFKEQEDAIRKKYQDLQI